MAPARPSVSAQMARIRKREAYAAFYPMHVVEKTVAQASINMICGDEINMNDYGWRLGSGNDIMIRSGRNGK